MIATWEKVAPDSVQTPRELFDSLVAEGYKVDYARHPVTDGARFRRLLAEQSYNSSTEQAPIAEVFAGLEERIRHSLAKGSTAFAFNWFVLLQLCDGIVTDSRTAKWEEVERRRAWSLVRSSTTSLTRPLSLPKIVISALRCCLTMLYRLSLPSRSLRAPGVMSERRLLGREVRFAILPGFQPNHVTHRGIPRHPAARLAATQRQASEATSGSSDQVRSSRSM